MKVLDPLRVWWQKRTGEEETPFDGDVPAWAISLMVHLSMLLILSWYTFGLIESKGIQLLTTEDTEVIEKEQIQEIEQLPEEFAFSEVEQEKIGANSVGGGTGAALAMAQVISDISQVPTPRTEAIAEVGIPVVQSPVTVATGPNYSPNMMVRGSATGVGATGAMGAIDRITHEILLSLEQRKTLVVWAFDKSGSLARQREAIRDRFDRIYEELGVIEASGNKAFSKHTDKPLLTSVVAFGNDLQLLTAKPTDDLYMIKAAVEAIKNDSTGVEKTFSCVYDSAKRFASYRMQEPKRNVMIIVVTDEAGDDVEGLDMTVDICRRYQMPVYVVGVPAPFGRKEIDIKYVDPDPEFNQAPQWIPVHQGPESLMPERVKLAFSGSTRDEPIDSGFGPYGLTRLCLETGGIYFAVHPNRTTEKRVTKNEIAELAANMEYFFDPVVMRRYQPDYVSVEEYKKRLTKNNAKKALVEASMLTWAAPLEAPQLRFPKVSEADLANLLSKAQQEAAKLEPKVENIYSVLALGEKDRPKLDTLRWQAGYDLAMGHTLAVLVRTKGYNGMLAQAKQGLKFQDPKNDTWVLKPSDKISVGSVLEKQGQQALVYLNRVVKEHPGTPWAMLADRALKEPLGWEWEESYTGVNAPREGMGGDGNAAAQANDKMKKMEKPKPVRVPKL